MMNIKSILSIARAETLVIRRMARYWLFLSFSFLFVFIAFIYYSTLHGLFSSQSATVGLLSPRFLMSSIAGVLYLVIYSIGVIFLAFDVRARDLRERMYEVLDSRPYSNLELVTGRFLGVLIPAWIPMLLLIVLIELLGILLKTSGILPIGEPVEIISLLSFVFLIGLPTFAFIISGVFLITLLARNRLVASVILLLLIGATYGGMYLLPVYKARLFDFMGILQSGLYPSDILSSFMPLTAVIHRGAILLASIGILGICAAVHPRLDDLSRGRTGLTGAIIVAIAAVIIGGIFLNNLNVIKDQEKWLTAQMEHPKGPVPDITKITGKVDILPGKTINLDLKIAFRSPETGTIKNAIFTLNPGQKVVELLDASGKPLSYKHENGILDVSIPEALSQSEETVICLKTEGIPNKYFAYLKSAINPLKLDQKNSNTALLGNQNYVFDKNFVALMPAIRWLPMAGIENEMENQRVDFFNVDLTVGVPKGWLVAGPGKRNKAGEEKNYDLYRFAPPSVVPEVAIIASEYESRSFETDGIIMELLVHKKHMKNLDVLADTGDKIKEYINTTLKDAKEAGLSYPYDGLTLVEVPTVLRTYGGGWRLDTVQSMPGIMLLRELSLPTSRFDLAFRNPDRFKNQEGGIVKAKWDRLQTYFQQDFSGGNVFTGAARNFFLFQTSAGGREGMPVNFVMDTLAGLVITDTKGYFSAHVFADGLGINQIIRNVLVSYFQLTNAGINDTILSSTIRTRTSRPVVWEKALKESLMDIDPWKDPANTVDYLMLKGYAVADSIYKTLGREKTAAFLASIRKAHTGGSFTVSDMKSAAKEQGYDMDESLGDWIGSTGLSGFVVSEARAYRIKDDANGSPRYQLLFTVRNDEPVPGTFYFAYYYTAENQKSELTQGETVHLAGRHAIRYGTIVSRLPSMYFLAPVLSYNRSTFEIQMAPINHEHIVDAEIIEGVKDIPWEIPSSSSIIADDLDEGFSIIDDKAESKGLRITAKEKKKNTDTDQGLPYTTYTVLPGGLRLPSEWTRISNGMTYGKYRHTAAYIRKGEGAKKAVFSVALPQASSWDLEIYIPMKNVFPNKKWGTWHGIVTDINGDKHQVEFDSKAGAEGWNLAGKYDLPQGKCTLEISDSTDGDIVVADAIRWTPSAGN
jgi:ABC-type transport system involved in multi-copper enzyme maturation permease subunit